jgi:hypothetical protein
LNRIGWAVAACSLAAACLIPIRAFAKPTPIIPLDEGTEWTYSASVEWTVENSNHVRRDSIQWKMRVLETFKTPTVTVAVISGFVTDLAWYEPEKKPSFSVLVENPSGLFETYMNPSATEADASELAKKALKGELVGDQMLRFPIRVGDCLDNDDPQRLRTDNRYCWFVKSRVHDLHGLAWVLRFDSNPDTTTLRVVPGVGIIRFSYDHHGTVASADAHLISFHVPTHH